MTDRDPHWHVIQSEYGREASASIEISRLGWEAYLPMLPVTRRGRDGKAERINGPRFPGYLFARFDSAQDDWGALLTAKAKRAGIVCVLCYTADDGSRKPSRVPGSAIAAMRAYLPPPDRVVSLVRYRVGEPVVVYATPGHAQQAVFLGYRRDRARVRLWILGAERDTTVSVSSLDRPSETEAICG